MENILQIFNKIDTEYITLQAQKQLPSILMLCLHEFVAHPRTEKRIQMLMSIEMIKQKPNALPGKGAFKWRSKISENEGCAQY